jgi:hypothetical protein
MVASRQLTLVVIAVLVSACGGGGERGTPQGSAADAPPGVQTVAFSPPGPTSGEFCVAVQKFLANTAVEGTNTVFTDMPSYRHSKPAPNPLLIYQVVTYAGKLPIMVSCKVKTAAHLRATYGPAAAGEQRFCPAVTRELQSATVAALRQENDLVAAERAAAFVIDEDEPFITGRDYLADFELSYRGADGAVHIRSHGLFQNYDSWITALLPRRVQGQSYCHLATVEYLRALATGAMEPGTLITTAADAPVNPTSG